MTRPSADTPQWLLVDEGWGRSAADFAALSEPSNCPIQKSAIETAQRFWPIASPGPASFPTELSVA